MFQLIQFSIGILLQAYACVLLVFHKGGENSIFIFQLVFVFPLPCFMIENSHLNLISYTWKEKYSLLISRCLFEYVLKLVYQNFCLKINSQNVLIYIAYMQGELNISSTYRFMIECILYWGAWYLFFMWYTCVGGASHLLLCIT